MRFLQISFALFSFSSEGDIISEGRCRSMSKVWTAVTALVLAAVMSVPVLADTFVDTGILRLVNSSHRISKDFVPEMVQYKNTSYYKMFSARWQ